MHDNLSIVEGHINTSQICTYYVREEQCGGEKRVVRDEWFTMFTTSRMTCRTLLTNLFTPVTYINTSCKAHILTLIADNDSSYNNVRNRYECKYITPFL